MKTKYEQMLQDTEEAKDVIDKYLDIFKNDFPNQDIIKYSLYDYILYSLSREYNLYYSRKYISKYLIYKYRIFPFLFYVVFFFSLSVLVSIFIFVITPSGSLINFSAILLFIISIVISLVTAITYLEQKR